MSNDKDLPGSPESPPPALPAARRKAFVRGDATTPTVLVRPGDAVYQGRTVVDAEGKALAELAPRDSIGRTTIPRRTRDRARAVGMSPNEARFMGLLAGGATMAAAYLAVFPKSKPVYAATAGSKLRKRIEGKLGKETYWTVMGLGSEKIARVVKDAMDAKMIKVFINAKTGEIVESPEYVDHSTRLAAGKFAAELTGLTRADGAAGPVQIQIVNYAPPGSPPWPGGGRT